MLLSHSQYLSGTCDDELDNIFMMVSTFQNVQLLTIIMQTDVTCYEKGGNGCRHCLCLCVCPAEVIRRTSR